MHCAGCAAILHFTTTIATSLCSLPSDAILLISAYSGNFVQLRLTCRLFFCLLRRMLTIRRYGVPILCTLYNRLEINVGKTCWDFHKVWIQTIGTINAKVTFFFVDNADAFVLDEVSLSCQSLRLHAIVKTKKIDSRLDFQFKSALSMCRIAATLHSCSKREVVAVLTELFSNDNF